MMLTKADHLALQLEYDSNQRTSLKSHLSLVTVLVEVYECFTLGIEGCVLGIYMGCSSLIEGIQALFNCSHCSVSPVVSVHIKRDSSSKRNDAGRY